MELFISHNTRLISGEEIGKIIHLQSKFFPSNFCSVFWKKKTILSEKKLLCNEVFRQFYSNYERSFFRTNAIEQFRATVTGDLTSGTLIFDYGDGRVNTMYYIGGDLENYIIVYDCVSCNDYGDQGSE
jgi:hypothetical protein